MIRINLLRPESKEGKERVAAPAPEFKEKKPTQIGGVVFLLVIAGLIVGFFMQRQALQKEKDLLENAKREKSQLQYVIASLDQLSSQKANFEQKINLINLLKARQPISVIIMDELSKNIPPEWVWLTEVSFDNITVNLKGNALSNNLIADYIRDLENSPSFKNVNIIGSSQKGVAGAEQILEFGLSIEYDLPLEAQPPAPETAKPVKRGKK